VDNLGLLIAGYALTGLALAAYVSALVLRARRARDRTAALAARRPER
jgi:hypothetical protein